MRRTCIRCSTTLRYLTPPWTTGIYEGATKLGMKFACVSKPCRCCDTSRTRLHVFACFHHFSFFPRRFVLFVPACRPFFLPLTPLSPALQYGYPIADVIPRLSIKAGQDGASPRPAAPRPHPRRRGARRRRERRRQRGRERREKRGGGRGGEHHFERLDKVEVEIQKGGQ